jgi:hypothetical protein
LANTGLDKRKKAPIYILYKYEGKKELSSRASRLFTLGIDEDKHHLLFVTPEGHHCLVVCCLWEVPETG